MSRDGGMVSDIGSEYLTWQIQWNPRGWCSCMPARNQSTSWSGLCRRTPSPWCRWWWSSQSLLAVWDICSSGEESLQSNNVFFYCCQQSSSQWRFQKMYLLIEDFTVAQLLNETSDNIIYKLFSIAIHLIFKKREKILSEIKCATKTVTRQVQNYKNKKWRWKHRQK